MMNREFQWGATLQPIPVGIALALACIVVPAIILSRQHAEAAEVLACRSNLQQFAAAYMKYMDDSPDHIGPPMSNQAKNLMIADDAQNGQGFFPKYMDRNILRCPATMNKDYPATQKADDSQFMYVGYMLEDEDDIHAFTAYYATKTAKGEPLEDVIPLPKPRPDGRNAILRLRLLKDQPEGTAWKGWYPDPSVIPVLVERGSNHGETGAHVVFLDGHIEYFPFSRASIWPFSRGGISSLKDID